MDNIRSSMKLAVLLLVLPMFTASANTLVADFSYTPATPSYFEVVTFNALSSYDTDGYITHYIWDFNGDGKMDASGVVAKYVFKSNTMSPTNYTVTLTVIDNDGNMASVSKTVRVFYTTDTNPPFMSIPTTVKENEPNNQLGDATEIQINSNVTGIIYPAGDYDSYKVYIPTPGKLTINLNKVPNDMRARIDLYDKNFRWIRAWDASNAGDTLKPKIDIVTPGYYYIGIKDLDGKSHTTEYAFKVDFKP